MSHGFGGSLGTETPDARCKRIGAGQHGVITRRQARGAGLTDARIDGRVRSGQWERLHPGVFRVSGTPRTWHQRLIAACLWAGDGSAVSHRSAAALLGFEGFETDLVEISSARRKPPVPGGGLLHLVRQLEPIDLTRKDGIPVTTVIRTLVDLGSVVDRERVEVALDHTLRHRMTTIDQLKKHLDRVGGRGKHGAGVLRRILADREKMPTESTLERRFLALVKTAKLPRPQSQVRVGLPGGNYRLDFVWPAHRIVVECEGYFPHSGPEMWERDRLRRNRLTIRGWRVLHFTWKEVTENPERVLATVRAALGIEALPV